jgi:alanyl-tRNA synthetase
MTSDEIRRRFLKYFEGKGHTRVPSSGLIPKGDPTLLFTNAGMVQFKGVLLGEEKRDYVRAVACQKCMRAGGKHNDLENVGRTARHHTFFEMLGNFSFGDYFKEDAITFGWDFLTRELGIDGDKLYVTVFEKDDEAETLWRENIGLPPERIKRMGEKDNFWAMGDVGPCGPCSEIIIDQGKGIGCGRPTCGVGCDCDRYLELWNLVFMQYTRDRHGRLTPLPKPSIDTGMGLERLSAVMQGKNSNYDTDLFTPIIGFIEELAEIKYTGGKSLLDVSIMAVADHARAVTFLITDGVLPSNEGRGYVLRRIIRRAARHGRFLGIKKAFLYKVNDKVIELMRSAYPELNRNRELVSKATRSEEERFFETLERGLTILEEEVASLKKKKEKIIPGSFAFKLYDTYGFPADLTADIVRKDGFTVDEEGFSKAMEVQRRKARESWKGSGETITQELYKNLSASGLKSTFIGYHMDVAPSKVLCIIKDGNTVERAAAGDKVQIITEETPFYGEAGGQVGDKGVIVGKGLSIRVNDTQRPLADLIVHHCVIEEGTVAQDDTVELVLDIEQRKATQRNHTATHLLHSALREVLGEHIRQSGSLVGPRGFRFDFNHFAALDEKTIRRIDEQVNRDVRENLEVETEVLPYQLALERGALAFFGEKYEDVVRMVQVRGVSTELCGGTHVKRTGDIGMVKITSESSIAAGVRRIEAVTGEAAIEKINKFDSVLTESARMLTVSRLELPEKIERLLKRQKELERENSRLKGMGKADRIQQIIDGVRTVNDVKVVASEVETAEAKDLREMADTLRTKLGSGIVILGTLQNGKVSLLAAVTKDLTKRFNAGEIVKRLATVIGGKGGGRPDMAQAGGKLPERLGEALEKAYKAIEEMAKGKNLKKI